MSDKRFENTVESLFKGLDGFLTTKSVVGEAVKFDDGTVILPLVDVSFGMGAGSYSKDENKGGNSGGMGGKITPSAVVVVKDGHAKLVNIKNQDAVTKVLDMVPDIVDKVSETIKDRKNKKDIKEKIDSVVEDLDKN